MRERHWAVVVIEDNPTDVFLVRQAVETRHLDVGLTVYEDGEEALHLIDSLDAGESVDCPDLLLLDLNLPRTDGFAVLNRLRHSGKCCDIPVIVMTSSAAQTDQARSRALGANAYFQKPAGYDAFLEIGDLMRGFLEH